MKNHGYVKVGAAIPSVRVADLRYNVAQIKAIVAQAVAEGVEIVVMPEMCITGYSCQDLFRATYLLDKSDEALDQLQHYCSHLPIVVIVGAPVRSDGQLMNAAVVLAGSNRHVVAKTYLPNYGEFYERRWFSPSSDGVTKVFELPSGVKFGIELCEDLWSPLPPSSYATLAGADIMFNLSATDELAGKHNYLMSLLSQQSARCLAGYVYSSAGYGESTQDVVYGGNAIIYENGTLLSQSRRFQLEPQLVTAQIDVERLRAERVRNTTFAHAQTTLPLKTAAIALDVDTGATFKLERRYNPYPFIPSSESMSQSCEEILNIQVMGLVRRLEHAHCKNVVIGVSGGLDSTLALLVCVKAFDRLKLDRKGVHGITMPGFGTTGRTRGNALRLMESLAISVREIDISGAVLQHFADIRHDSRNHDVTYENSQARYRTMLLMDIANQVGGMVVGTGDMSELALGWCTYNGDHMSMYGVNAGVPKTLIRHLVSYVARSDMDHTSRGILLDVIDTPISPELVPADDNGNIKQQTELIVGPYDLHDFFLYHFVRFGFSPEKLLLMARNTFCGKGCPHYDDATISRWLKTFLRRFFAQQFKRSCLPDGPKVGSVSLSPRGDWRMASDAAADMWICE